MKPIMTTIIPAYNSEHYIKRCLDSLNHPEIKSIIIDDGSTDKTARITDEYCRCNPNFHVIHTDNQGAMKARQMGLDYVDTQYFSFIDSDDTVNIKNYLELCYAMQEKGYEVGNGRSTVYLPDCPIPFHSKKWSKTEIDFLEDKKELSNTTCTFWGKIFSENCKELFQGSSNQKVYEDLEFVYHALVKKRYMLHSNNLLYNYHMHKNSTSATGLDSLKVDGLSGLLSATTSMQEKFKKSGLLDEYQNELDAITIKLVYQRIYNILIHTNIANKKEMAELIFQILSAYLPQWKQNPYLLEGFKGSELNDYLFYIATKILVKIYNVEQIKSTQEYEALLSSYDQKLVLKR